MPHAWHGHWGSLGVSPRGLPASAALPPLSQTRTPEITPTPFQSFPSALGNGPLSAVSAPGLGTSQEGKGTGKRERTNSAAVSVSRHFPNLSHGQLKVASSTELPRGKTAQPRGEGGDRKAGKGVTGARTYTRAVADRGQSPTPPQKGARGVGETLRWACPPRPTPGSHRRSLQPLPRT